MKQDTIVKESICTLPESARQSVEALGLQPPPPVPVLDGRDTPGHKLRHRGLAPRRHLTQAAA